MNLKLKNSIKMLRVGRDGMTQSQLAGRLGISRQALGNIEKGKSSPGLGVALKIAEVFNVRVDDVFSLAAESMSIDGFRLKVINAMWRYFGDDQKRINHAMDVLKYAEKIRVVVGGDEMIVVAAGVLHDIGIKKAEEKYGSAAGRFQEIEGPSVAWEMLNNIGVDEKKIRHVCQIVGSHHSGKDIDTVEFRCIWDADWIVNIEDELKGFDKERLKKFIEKTLRTDIGKEIACENYNLK